VPALSRRPDGTDADEARPRTPTAREPSPPIPLRRPTLQLAIGGVDGTLHKRFRDARSHRAIRAKTGTLDDAIALSGYVLGPPGKGTVAYAILFNKVSGRGGAARAAADKLVGAVHDRSWK
jgi:D-alanyl-D-alanine carboxypeptidase/D-alanyl-D-alanine-endopeptidase (penicillin-binding protein 4)